MLPTFKPENHKIRVVLPVCQKDKQLMLKNLIWQRQLDGRKDYDCVLAIDGSMSSHEIEELERAAWGTYSLVETYIYPTSPNKSWPYGPNWAFQHVARHMESGKRAWFWMEADCVPICPQWLIFWNQEYSLCKRSVMGAVVQGMGHCNGTAIYPANIAKLSHDIMTCTGTAWDAYLKNNVKVSVYDASHLICHVWGIESGRARPFGGVSAHFSSWKDVERWVDLGAVLFHRAKDGSLIDRLREKIECKSGSSS